MKTLLDMKLWLGLLAIVIILLYASSVHAPPLLDDLPQIQHARHLQNVSQLLGRDCYGFFRPVKNLFFAALVRVAPETPWVWHATSIVLFLGCVILVWRYFDLLLRGSLWAVSGAAVWALAPTQVSSVSWASCINILVMTAGVVGCLLAYEAARRCEGAKQRKYLALSAGSFAVALLSYEAAIATLGLLVVHDALMERRRVMKRSKMLCYGVLSLVAVVYLVVRHVATSDVSISNDQIGPLPAWKLSLSSGYFTVYHLGLWLWPFGRQTILGTFPFEHPHLRILMGGSWIVLAAVCVLAWVMRRKVPEFTIGLAWFLVSFAPLSNVVPLYTGPLADYYLVIPSIGLSLALVAIAEQATDQWGWRGERMPAGLLVGPALALLLFVWRAGAVVETAFWAHRWNSEEQLLRTTLEARPGTFTARAELARLLAESGRQREAEAMAHRAVREAPWHMQGYYSLAEVLKRRADYAGAAGVLSEVVKQRPNDPTPLVLKGHAQERMGQFADAEASYLAALALPWDYEYSKTAAINLGGYYYSSDRLQDAIDVWAQASERDPDAVEFHVNLVVGYMKLGRYEEARKHADEAQRLGHDLPPGLLNELGRGGSSAGPQP